MTCNCCYMVTHLHSVSATSEFLCAAPASAGLVSGYCSTILKRYSFKPLAFSVRHHLRFKVNVVRCQRKLWRDHSLLWLYGTELDCCPSCSCFHALPLTPTHFFCLQAKDNNLMFRIILTTIRPYLSNVQSIFIDKRKAIWK